MVPAVATDGAASADTRRENVLFVEFSVDLNFRSVEVCLVLVGFSISVVTSFDDWVEQFGESFVRFFITSDGTDMNSYRNGVLQTAQHLSISALSAHTGGSVYLILSRLDRLAQRARIGEGGNLQWR